MNLLLWPSSGEVMAQMFVSQSRGSSRRRVQFTFWTVKCNCLAGELLRFGYEGKKYCSHLCQNRGVRVTAGVIVSLGFFFKFNFILIPVQLLLTA